MPDAADIRFWFRAIELQLVLEIGNSGLQFVPLVEDLFELGRCESRPVWIVEIVDDFVREIGVAVGLCEILVFLASQAQPCSQVYELAILVLQLGQEISPLLDEAARLHLRLTLLALQFPTDGSQFFHLHSQLKKTNGARVIKRKKTFVIIYR